MVREESSLRRSCTSWVMNCNPSRCFLARFAMLTMKAAPSGCCMMLHTSSTTSRRGRGSWAAAAHTVSVQTMAAAGLSSGSSRCRSKTVTNASWASRSSPSSESRSRRLPVAKGLQQVGDLRRFPFQVGVEVAEAGALPLLGVVGGQGVVQGGTALGGKPFPHHHLDQPAQAADALQQFLRIAPVDDKGVHALAGDAGGEDATTGGAGHVGVLALRVDDVGPHSPAQPPQHAQLGGETLAAAGAGQDGGVGVEVGAVEGVVDHRGAGPQVDAVEGAGTGVQVRRREGEQPCQRRRIQRPPHRHGVQGQRQG